MPDGVVTPLHPSRLSRTGSRHVLAALHGVAETVVNDAAVLSGALQEALRHAGAPVIENAQQELPPGIAVLAWSASSHAIVHTWPSCRLVRADIVTCGPADAEQALQMLMSRLQPQWTEQVLVSWPLGAIASPPAPDRRRRYQNRTSRLPVSPLDSFRSPS
ncbi:S-adenosylmethionine decarboxylase [Streptosporangium sandarakinum]|uniref:S-adenosylmethionine decarboxylase n=1 Tax=Streptosporangium sandarakinum TaxID=1260955 RepID=UPI0037A0E538